MSGAPGSEKFDGAGIDFVLGHGIGAQRRLLDDGRAVLFDSDGSRGEIEPFFDSMTRTQVMNLEFGPEGSLYVLDYGTGFFTAFHAAWSGSSHSNTMVEMSRKSLESSSSPSHNRSGKRSVPRPRKPPNSSAA